MNYTASFPTLLSRAVTPAAWRLLSRLLFALTSFLRLFQQHPNVLYLLYSYWRRS